MNANIAEGDPTNFKVCIIGEEGVGKTAILNRYITGAFVSNYKPTIAAAFMSAHEIVGDHTVTLNIWDTAGQEKYQSMMPLYLRNVDCVILVCDVIKPTSAQYVERWIEQEFPSIRPAPILLVCINKSDCQQSYNTQNLEESMKEKGIKVFFTSSLNGNNIAAVFNTVGTALDEESARRRPEVRKIRTKNESEGCCKH
ncbi:small GTP-binding protein, putative [Trichomonas vaginalis G3]|uniref:Small GTP-binding protein, putative n=1 Tax=Trichomonas vaginalis (strain ATCC PRA-98 / G3) TaxID=412133 RepID=A2FN85_TRIV3|nr:retrograde vesicle-mediated transport, Golgi to ER [Trichomonas vaginalis G3]EAX93644.1 small GTP-binding protein, putative [Trichomonas vaginalis G3]KAI5507089.1 retrograde vesicle-mediated transport, Golgi to ER [Trichomonas vaginalis G3]|eukprot:XP_001306574.1 small GTP-binding protein [Trichomonas vaginalis G3]